MASAQIQHVYLATTGDFGLDSNWSDPAKAPPETATITHNTYFYYINGNRTGTISAGSPNGSHFQVFHLFPGDNPPGEQPTPGTLIFEGGPEPAPGEFGASLTVFGVNRFIVGQRCNNWQGGGDPFGACGGGGEVIMNGSSDLLADGIVIGERDFGSLYIGPDARVRSGHVDGEGLSRQDFRIGSFGPSRGLTEPTPQRLEGEGYVEVHGTLVANTIYMPESGASGHLKVMPGGTVDIRGIDMSFQPNQSSRSALLELVGSTSTFTLFAGDLNANHPSVTIKFVADAAGVTTIVGGGVADVTDGNLLLDLDAYNFTPTSTLTLIDVDPFSLFYPFGDVTFLGSTTATVNYDEENGDVFLSNFMSTEPPGVIGDYNDDGIVDVGDFVVWRKFNGTSTTLPNDETSGSVLPVDYDEWREHFGESSAGAGSMAVPEPATLALVLFAVCLAGQHRRSAPGALNQINRQAQTSRFSKWGIFSKRAYIRVAIRTVVWA
jgi:hypothetical protein